MPAILLVGRTTATTVRRAMEPAGGAGAVPGAREALGGGGGAAVVALFAMVLVGLGCALAMALFHRYTDRAACPRYVRLATLASWLAYSCACILLPLDVGLSAICASTYCELLKAPAWENFLEAAWTALCWSSVVLGWLAVPAAQMYAGAGGFGSWQKAKAAAKKNSVACRLAAGAALLATAYVAATGDAAGAGLAVAAAANNCGLLIMIALMGHGLVNVPRMLWRSADRRGRLRDLHVRAPGVKLQVAAAETKVLDVATELKIAHGKVAGCGRLRELTDRLLAQCPQAQRSVQVLPAHWQDSRFPEVTVGYLAELQVKIEEAYAGLRRAQRDWEDLLEEAFFLQDAIDGNFEGSDRPTFCGIADQQAVRSLLWPLLARVLFAACAAASASIIIAEISSAVKSARGEPAEKTYAAAELVQTLTAAVLVYATVCVFSSLAELKPGLFKLAPYRRSEPDSLLRVSAYACRLVGPVCSNVLLVTGAQSSFSKVYADLGRYAAAAVVIPAVLTLAGLDGRVNGRLLPAQQGDVESAAEGFDIIQHALRKKRACAAADAAAGEGGSGRERDGPREPASQSSPLYFHLPRGRIKSMSQAALMGNDGAPV